ncbi:M-phase-specific PLK1-interacting protein [Lampris incognitus]|uniref:M-phase-specific PLK1-interacting protein n=1 Tax=Lampris incognitus TaxID=2546036 RepID=UPI0024B4BF0E|nr:M-phase-specific PLK1-interacting protein [Lampris incognitus]
MRRANVSQPSSRGTGPGGFCSPAADRGRFPSPARASFGSPSPGPRYGQYGCSPHSPGEFGGYNRRYSGAGGAFYNSSPTQTPRRQESPRGGSTFKASPYRAANPGPQHQRSFQGSPQGSAPFCRDRRSGGVERYYSPSMSQDPWVSLQPVAVSDTRTQYSPQHGRYF